MGAMAPGGALAPTAAAMSRPQPPWPPRPRPLRPVVRYAALGDADASGPAIPARIDANCTRSDHNRPHLVAAAGRTTDPANAGCRAAAGEQAVATAVLQSVGAPAPGRGR